MPQGAVNGALEALPRGLALEFAPVRANAVSPGLVATPMWSGMADAQRDKMFAGAAERLPLRCIGEAVPSHLQEFVDRYAAQDVRQLNLSLI